MHQRELNRVGVLAQVDDGRLSVDNAANMLDLTRRQLFRLLKRYRQDGAAAIRHKSRGRTPNNQIHLAKRDYALTVIKEQYPDFGPTLVAEMLAEHHGFKVAFSNNASLAIRRFCSSGLPTTLSWNAGSAIACLRMLTNFTRCSSGVASQPVK